MIEVTARLIRGSVYLAGETIECLITFRNPVINPNTRAQSNNEVCETLAWASAQIHCQCSVNDSKVQFPLTNSISQEELATNNKETSFAPCKGERGHAVLSTKPKILFCDVRLIPGEKKTFIYKDVIPMDVPPSYKGQAIKYSYKITIGTQRVNCPIKLLRVPFKVLVVQGLIEANLYSDADDLLPSNPFLTSQQTEPTLDLAMQLLQNVTTRRNPSCYCITNTYGRVVKFCLFKPAYKLGEDIVGTFDFSTATVPCVQVFNLNNFSVTLQSEETISDECRLKAYHGQSVVSYNKYHEFCLHTKHTQMILPIPLSITPAFTTEIVTLKWKLHFEFVTTTTSIGNQQFETDTSTSSTWSGPSVLDIETMIWDLPIKIYPTNPIQVSYICMSLCDYDVYMNQFAVNINGDDKKADEIAAKHGFLNHGQIGSLEGYYLFEHNHVSKRSTDRNEEHHEKLMNEKEVLWVDQQKTLTRVKRDINYPGVVRFFGFRTPYNGEFPDPMYSKQWYLHQGASDGWDMNVLGAWRKGYTGYGVVVSILDDGIQTDHPDLMKNYDPGASTDINGNDADPTPQDNGDNKHGTRCAGEVAAVAFNDVCGVGIAFNASIGGVRMLDGTVNDAVEAKALSLNRHHIDIYSASWGPEDDGRTVDGPGPLARRAFIDGVTQGRNYKGSIFVWASGNGGRHVDNCNCDGYTNSIFTLSISSVSQRGLKPWYLEECSSTLATTYSSGTPGHDKNVVTVDMDPSFRRETMCTQDHTGTSASAPIAAAISALALEANPNLTWRDMQYLVVLTSRPEPLMKEEGWVTNGVKRKVSHKFGYGLMDATAMVNLAEQWISVPNQHICETEEDKHPRTIPRSMGDNLEIYMNTDACWNSPNVVNFLEHVQCRITLHYNPRGNLKIMLESPLGTRTNLLSSRPKDMYQADFQDWPFLTVHFWGEKAAGQWKLTIVNAGTIDANEDGILKKWSLVFHGTEQHPIHLKSHPGRNPFPYAPVGRSADPMTEEDSLFEDCHKECRDGCYGNGAEKCKACRHLQTDTEPRYLHKFLYGWSIHDSNKTCRQCNSVCNGCVGDINNCTECRTGLVMSHNECLKCHSTCETCMGPSPFDCVTCPANLVHQNGSCSESCPPGYFLHGHMNECYSCDPFCETCNATQCLTCRSNCVIDNEGKCRLKTECSKGNFLKDDQCSPCHLSCDSCEGPNYSQCLTCSTYLVLYKNVCTKKCPSNSVLIGNECQECHETCLKCSGSKSNQCLSCKRGLVLKNGVCSTVCGEKLFAADDLCLPCHHSCLTCSGPLDTDCISCGSNLQLGDGKCQQSCPFGSFPRNSSCISCHHTCLNCKGDALYDCLSCQDNYVLDNGLCMECQRGMFYDRVSQKCKQCDTSCTTCNGPDHLSCLSCTQPLKHDPVHHRCVPCCKNEFDQVCCVCDPRTDTCTSEIKRRIVAFSDSVESDDDNAQFPLLTFCVVAVATCIGLIIGFLVVYKILRQFGYRYSCCSSNDYQPVPTRFETSDLHICQENLLYGNLKGLKLNNGSSNIAYKTSQEVEVNEPNKSKKENDYAHAIMEKLDKYSGYLAITNQIESPESAKWKISEEEISKTCKNVTNLSDSEIENILAILCQQTEHKETSKSILTALDQECIVRLLVWDVRTSLRMADYFYHLNVSRLLMYNYRMISHLIGRIRSLNSSEIIQLLFYINVQRECDLKVMVAVENELLKRLPQFSSEEVSIAALAFFKTKNSLKSKNLVKMMQQKFISDLDKLPDPAVSAFGKLFRFQRTADPALLLEVLDKSLPYITKWKPSACLNVGLITLSRQLEHEEYVKSTALKFLNNLSVLRVKELSHLLTCVSTYDYHLDFAPDFYSLLIAELRKPEMQTQLMEHPLYLPLCLLGLAYHEIFPEDLIQQALNPDFFNLVESKMKYGQRREYLMLDSTVEIELPNYSGPRLDPTTKRNLWQADRASIPSITNRNLSIFEKTLLTLKYQLSDLLGGLNYASILFVLPHFKLPEIVIHLDENKHPLSTNHLRTSHSHITAEKNVKSICFTLTGRNSYAENTKKRLAHVKMKHRQLELLGYHVIEIPWFDYFVLDKTQRLNYVKKKLLPEKSRMKETDLLTSRKKSYFPGRMSLRRRKIGAKIAFAKEGFGKSFQSSSDLMNPASLWMQTIPTENCDVLLTFPSKCENSTIMWVLSCLRTRLPQLDVRVRHHATSKTYGFYMTTNFENLLKGAEEMHMRKHLKEEYGGGLKEFIADGQKCFEGVENSKEFFSSLERQSIVLHLLHSLRAIVSDSVGNVKFVEGQAIIPKCVSEGIISQVLPLHKEELVEQLRLNWVRAFFKTQPLDAVCEYFGVKIAIYFAWLGHYTSALIIPAAFGLFLWIIFHGRNQVIDDACFVLFAFLNVLWSSLYLISWKRYCAELTYRWGTYDDGNELLVEPRPLYTGDLEPSKVTGRPEPCYPAWKRNLFRYCISLPVIIFFLSIVLVVMLAMFRFQEIWDKMLIKHEYPFFLTYVPKISLALVISILDTVYQKVAVWLNNQENYRLEETYENHLILKIVVFQFVNSFLSLFYLAFYLRDMEKLREQLAALLITRQVIGNIRESFVPFMLEQFKLAFMSFEMFGAFSPDNDNKFPNLDDILDLNDGGIPENGKDEASTSSKTQNARNLSQAEVESSLYPYDGTFEDYLEMFIQFGYVILFSSAFPLAALCALLNNVIEIRSDAFKLCCIFQRPFGQHVKGIGTWQEAMEAMCVIAVIVNCALIGMSGQVHRMFPDQSTNGTIILIVVLEHITLTLKMAICRSIPDTPHWVATEMAKVEFNRREAVKKLVRTEASAVLRSSSAIIPLPLNPVKSTDAQSQTEETDLSQLDVPYRVLPLETSKALSRKLTERIRKTSRKVKNRLNSRRMLRNSFDKSEEGCENGIDENTEVKDEPGKSKKFLLKRIEANFRRLSSGSPSGNAFLNMFSRKSSGQKYMKMKRSSNEDSDEKSQLESTRRTVAEYCDVARAKCHFRDGCGLALRNYMFDCADMMAGRTARCSESCSRALIALMSTEEGQLLVGCDCGDNEFCTQSKQRVEVCRPLVTGAMEKSAVVSCSVAHWICKVDSLCNTALAYYHRFCRSMIHGRKCTPRCNNSIAILNRQEKADKLRTCFCDGSEEYDCNSIKRNMQHLCFKKRNIFKVKNTHVKGSSTTVGSVITVASCSCRVCLSSSLLFIFMLFVVFLVIFTCK
uniref:furin n=1 Tax=Strigamia maritima TaxID=126957 RepID=T1IMB0_STRMM